MVTFGFGVVDARSTFSHTGQGVVSVDSINDVDKLVSKLAGVDILIAGVDKLVYKLEGVDKLVYKLEGVDKLVYKPEGVELNSAVAKLSSKLDATEDVKG